MCFSLNGIFLATVCKTIIRFEWILWLINLWDILLSICDSGSLGLGGTTTGIHYGPTKHGCSNFFCSTTLFLISRLCIILARDSRRIPTMRKMTLHFWRHIQIYPSMTLRYDIIGTIQRCLWPLVLAKLCLRFLKWLRHLLFLTNLLLHLRHFLTKLIHNLFVCLHLLIELFNLSLDH